MPLAMHETHSALALVLVVEERHCIACRRIHTAPSKSLMVRLHTPMLSTANAKLIPRHKYLGETRDLPHERVTVISSVERCHVCFQSAEHGQLDLFPRQMPVRLSLAVILEKKRLEAEAERIAKGEKPKTPSKAAKARKEVDELFGDL